MDGFNAEAFRSFAFYGAILGIKLIAMSPLTATTRIKKKTFANPEDTGVIAKGKVGTDEDVERTRRAHLNDLENILPFFILGWLYCFTNPGVSTANLIFKVFTIARVVHTIVYAVCPLPQPARGLSFFVGFFINIYLAFQVLFYFW